MMRKMSACALMLSALAACTQAPQTTTADTAVTAAPAAPAPAAAAPMEAPAPAAAPESRPAPVAVKRKPAPVVRSNSTSDEPARSVTRVAEVTSPPTCNNCGVITAIAPIKVEAKGSGAGAVAGGIAGLIVGNQIGEGNGKTLAKIAGAVGGAYAGNKIEKKARAQTQYDVTVQMENGETSKLTLTTEPALAVGARVRVVDGALIAR